MVSELSSKPIVTALLLTGTLVGLVGVSLWWFVFQGPGTTTAESYRVDLGTGVVVAFVEERSPARVAYVTHVPSGSQLILDIDGRVIDRHDGRDDGPGRLDAVLGDEASMERIMVGLRSYEDPPLGDTQIYWTHTVRFGGTQYQYRGEPVTPGGERALTLEDLGHVLYQVVFRGDGYALEATTTTRTAMQPSWTLAQQSMRLKATLTSSGSRR